MQSWITHGADCQEEHICAGKPLNTLMSAYWLMRCDNNEETRSKWRVIAELERAHTCQLDRLTVWNFISADSFYSLTRLTAACANYKVLHTSGSSGDVPGKRPGSKHGEQAFRRGGLFACVFSCSAPAVQTDRHRYLLGHSDPDSWQPARMHYTGTANATLMEHLQVKIPRSFCWLLDVLLVCLSSQKGKILQMWTCNAACIACVNVA